MIDIAVILEIKNLTVSYKTNYNFNKALDDINLSIYKDEIFGLVGESGSGKTSLALSLTRLLPKNAFIESGQVIFKTKDLLKESEFCLQQIRGAKISYIFQEPQAYLNPVLSVGEQLIETILFHQEINLISARQEAIELLRAVRIQDPESCLKKYPHELSGGMNQRIMIAIALSSRPEILIADEPTTALDVTIEAEIIGLLIDLKKKFNFTIIFITHNLFNIKKIATRVAIMYKGKIIELGEKNDIFSKPQSVYTQELINSLERYVIKNR
ncbi:MAG: ABC transporter ATP-binding protein [Candidatus Omnitrophota bacterium]